MPKTTMNFSMAVLLLAAFTISEPAKASQPANAHKPGASPGWKAGFAEADITPGEKTAVMLAGFGNPRVVKEVELPIRAQALAIEDRNGSRVILHTADVLGFGRTPVDAVRYKLRERHHLLSGGHAAQTRSRD